MTPQEAAAVVGESFSLAEGFTLHFVLSPAPREARAFLTALKERAEARSLEIADSYVAWGARAKRPNTPLTVDDLEAELHEGLVRLERLAVADAPALVLDASCTHPHDLPAWRVAFARLNEARNGVMQQLPTNIVLLLDAAMGREAISTAPDVWSVRTNQIPLSGERRVIEPSAWQREASDELMLAVSTVRSAGTSTLPEIASGSFTRPMDLSSPFNEDWIPAAGSDAVVNRALVAGLAGIRPFPMKPAMRALFEPDWRWAARAVFEELPRACRVLEWSELERRLGALSATRPSARVREAVYLLVAFEAFAKGAFPQAESCFAEATRSVPADGGYPMLFPLLGRCLASAAVGRIEEARALFFDLEAFAWSGESLAAERLFATRGAELYRLFGDERRASIQTAMCREAVH